MALNGEIMSNVTLLVILSALVLLCGVFLTFSWQKYLGNRRHKKHPKGE
jgi:hypothetical protein